MPSGGACRLALGGALILLAAAPALTAPPHLGRITDVTPAEGKTVVTVLVRLPQDRVVHPGQSAEIVRGAKARVIGYGVVKRIFKEIATVEIGTLIDPKVPPLKGDDVRFLDGFKRGSIRRGPTLARGKVASSHGGLVLLDFGRRAGLKAGHEVLLRDPKTRVEQGRVEIELIRERSGSGVLLSGRAVVGAEAVVLGFVKPKPGVDFVELNLLGVVASQRDRRRGALGIYVQRVLPRSPAHKAGVLRGDRILAVNGHVVRDIVAIRQRIEARSKGAVTVLLIRAERVLSYPVDFPRK
ncbi:MAG: PDZ domain-containing protein [Planctomycetes bacterium]|nr:PDZ domain-containing protein [Planctomycetota bacterium]